MVPVLEVFDEGEEELALLVVFLGEIVELEIEVVPGEVELFLELEGSVLVELELTDEVGDLLGAGREG